MGIFPHGGVKKLKSHVLKYLTYFSQKLIGPSNSFQQWGMNPPEQMLVKV
jgi:hypothetical protein